jgi:hypothetical protein
MIDRGKYVRLTNGERRILIGLCEREINTISLLLAGPEIDGPTRDEHKVARTRQRQLKRMIYQLNEVHIEPAADPGEAATPAAAEAHRCNLPEKIDSYFVVRWDCKECGADWWLEPAGNWERKPRAEPVRDAGPPSPGSGTA